MHGDACDVSLPETVDVVACVFNTFFMLGDPARQNRCAQSIAESLSPDGTVVIEVFNPDTQLFETCPPESVHVSTMTAQTVVLSARRVNRSSQTISGQEIVIAEDRVRLVPHVMHYRSALELDDLFSGVGLTCSERFGDWNGSAWTKQSRNSILVYRRPSRVPLRGANLAT